MQRMCLLALFYRSYFLPSFLDSGFSIFFRGEWLKIILVSFSRLFHNFKLFIHFFVKDGDFYRTQVFFTKILIPEVFPNEKNEVLGMSHIQWDASEPISSNSRAVLKKIANFLDMQEQLSKAVTCGEGFSFCYSLHICSVPLHGIQTLSYICPRGNHILKTLLLNA